MQLKEISNREFVKMVEAASMFLNQNAEFINSLNVFPVPDGDTGTNMSLSLNSGLKYVTESSSTSVGELTCSLAKGLLMGARGNSGVILSQIFRGFSKSVEGKESLFTKDLALALSAGAEVAYKAVMKPTEGTILTVIRESAQAARVAAANSNDIVEVMDAAYKAADKALLHTPDLLPVLKQVGVVDSGGQGLTFVIQAFDYVLNGKKINFDTKHQPNPTEMDEMVDAEHHRSIQGKLDPNEIVYGYCTEMMIRLDKGNKVDKKFHYDEFYNYLAGFGDSLLVVNDDEIVKVHIHTENPGKIMSWGQKFGDLDKVKVDNMRLQQETIIREDQQETQIKNIKNPETAIVTIAAGAGIKTLFESLGATSVISGGQTMNPSTHEIVDAIQTSGAKQAIILPNNSNIFLAAEQARKIVRVPTVIVYSRSVSQGITALMGYETDNSLIDNKKSMESNLSTVTDGEITHAIRNTTIHGFNIKKGDFMGIIDGKISVVTDNLEETAIQMINKMLDDDSEIVTIIYGKDTTLSVAENIQNAILDIDDDLEIEIHEGDQPIYPFIISIE